MLSKRDKFGRAVIALSRENFLYEDRKELLRLTMYLFQEEKLPNQRSGAFCIRLFRHRFASELRPNSEPLVSSIPSPIVSFEILQLPCLGAESFENFGGPGGSVYLVSDGRRAEGTNQNLPWSP